MWGSKRIRNPQDPHSPSNFILPFYFFRVPLALLLRSKSAKLGLIRRRQKRERHFRSSGSISMVSYLEAGPAVRCLRTRPHSLQICSQFPSFGSGAEGHRTGPPFRSHAATQPPPGPLSKACAGRQWDFCPAPLQMQIIAIFFPKSNLEIQFRRLKNAPALSPGDLTP